MIKWLKLSFTFFVSIFKRKILLNFLKDNIFSGRNFPFYVLMNPILLRKKNEKY
jgi:hypothetical protein